MLIFDFVYKSLISIVFKVFGIVVIGFMLEFGLMVGYLDIKIDFF